MLEVTSLSKEYQTPGGSLPILSDISLTLKRGDAASIMGPSGSGKSTLLYILGALEPPSSGRLTLDSTDPFALEEKELAAFRNRRIGFIFQDHCLLPQCSVLENVLTPTLVSGADDSYLARARSLLKSVDLSHRITHRPAELSGGEKQRAALARAMIMKPLVLLADEPTGNLDRKSAEVVADLLLQLHREQETILIVVTHSQELAQKFPVRFEMEDKHLRRL